jgi:hypothetical protein
VYSHNYLERTVRDKVPASYTGALAHVIVAGEYDSSAGDLSRVRDLSDPIADDA